MQSRCCPCVCVCVCVRVSLLSLLGNGSVKVSLSLLGNGSVKFLTTYCVYYEITLLSVCAHIIVSFFMRFVWYQRKVGD
jgi:uncharacterized membrane protein